MGCVRGELARKGREEPPSWCVVARRSSTTPGLSPAQARAAARARVGALHYPPELPITDRKDDIVAALAANQVLVVAGETGSGKSTQLPKICLEAGRGLAGLIGHTQPRRIAARSIAERVAEELATPLGDAVGYKVRFSDHVGRGALVKLMTDGILLAELHGDPQLRSYDTLIIDEAHERSLNIDFLLGYLRQLLATRSDLKVVITSATIDTARFSEHFGGAPVVEVAGRTYPVELRYRPMEAEAADDDDETAETPGTSETPGTPATSAETGTTRVGGEPGQRSPAPSVGGGLPGADEAVDEVQAICDAVGELCHEGPGDILVFLAGEREIRDTADALSKLGLSGVEVLPLYGRLSSAEQHRVFEAHTGRRVVLATNVAETSLTVPGIRFVVDPGNARVSRYSRRTKVQRLPIEPISQASANQRAGRCGRLGPGICVRLYSEENFNARRLFTEPEVLRTNLASVVLQMAAIGLGDVEAFPFIDPPDRRNIKDGVTLLEELGAFAPGPARSLSPLGRKLAQLPLDPRLGRMVLEAERLGCLEDVLVITAGLSVQDPRERPSERRAAAAALHSRFEDASSDFVSYLNLWAYLDERQSELSSSQFRRLCRKEMISYQRAREWQDVHAQLGDLCRQLGLAPGGGRAAVAVSSPVGTLRGRGRDAEAYRARLHQALLAGLPTQVGVREGDRPDFSAPRGARFAIWPGSVLAKRSPRWVMAAELVETSRLWARVVAPVRPQWAEVAAAHLLKWTFGEAAWDASRGEAFVVARATLYGLPVVTGRQIGLARHDAGAARELFISHALVGADWDEAPGFVAANLDALAALQALVQRARRPDLMVSEEALALFYGSRLPADVVSGRSFDAWWRRQAPEQRAALRARPEDLQGTAQVGIDAAEFPDTWNGPAGDAALALHYNWEPGEHDDGVVVDVPLAELGRLGEEGLEWQVPGLREELVTELMRSLPKDVRRHLVPVPERARDFVAKSSPPDGPLLVVLARTVSELSGLRVLPRDFDWAKVPPYLRPTFRVVDEEGRPLAEGKEIESILASLRPRLRQALQAAARGPSTGWGPPGEPATEWAFGSLPRVFEADWHGYRLRGYPALVDQGETVSVEVFADEASAKLAMMAGTRRLLVLNLPARRALVDQLERQLDNRAKLALAGLGGLAYGSAREMAADVLAAAVDHAVARNGGPARDADRFASLVAAVRRDAERESRQLMAVAVRALGQLYEVSQRLALLRTRLAAVAPASVGDVAAELEFLAGPRFVSRAGAGRLPDVERYLAALLRRLDKLPAEMRRDAALAARALAARKAVADAVEVARQQALGPDVVHQLEDLYWVVEELRVSFWAQSLGTNQPVSEERIGRAIAKLLIPPSHGA